MENKIDSAADVAAFQQLWQSRSGLLAINKPSGMTSKDVSRRLTRMMGRKLKIGHVGTLDPCASGVLPILIGKATRLQDYLLDGEKIYVVEAEFGYQTDTLDFEGEQVAEASFAHISRELIEEELPNMIGEITQTPPIFSAVKYNGKPLYWYARSGRSAEVPLEELSRAVTIYGIELQNVQMPKFSMRVRCSKGTYIRTLVHDLAVRLDSLATMTALCREKTAGVDVVDCTPLAEVEANHGALEEAFQETSHLSLGLPRMTISSEEAIARLKNGQKLVGFREFSFLPIETGVKTEKQDGQLQLHILINSHGKVFGLGQVWDKKIDSCSVKMERGLA